MSQRYLRIKEVGEYIGYVPRSVYNLIKTAGFPSPIAMNSSAALSSVRWDKQEIDAWIEKRREARQADDRGAARERARKASAATQGAADKAKTA